MSKERIALMLTGRLVSGHPMELRAVTDDNGQAKRNAAGEARMALNIGIAIPKTAGVDWRQEAWGQVIVAKAMQDWPNGEHAAPAFAWKVTDGDSAVPNKKGNKPCDKDGYPGHWVVFASHELGPIRCFHAGKFQPHECIQDKAEIKRGDYGRLNVTVTGNNPSQSPGMYINPDIFCLDRPGEAIVGGESNAADVFGGGAPAAATAATPPATPPAAVQAAPPVQPAPDFLNTPPVAAPPVAAPPAISAGPVMTAKAGGATYESFTAAGWTHAQLVEHGYVQV